MEEERVPHLMIRNTSHKRQSGSLLAYWRGCRTVGFEVINWGSMKLTNSRSDDVPDYQFI